MNGTKTCTKCRQEKPADQFGHNPRTRDKLTHRCNDCRDTQ